jgi:hypothetical protein
MDGYLVALIILVAIACVILFCVTEDMNSRYSAIKQSQATDGTNIDNGDDPWEQKEKETFFAIGGDGAHINKMGTIVGQHIYTNGLLNQPWDEITRNIEDGKPVGDKAVLGASAGDGFSHAWDTHKQQVEISEGKEIGVKTPEEIAAIEKKLARTHNNNVSCMYNRGGASKQKIIIDKLGCRGVTDTYDTPERDRNHKIYDGGSVVYVPGYDVNMTNLTKELTYKGKGWAKDFAGNTVQESTPVEAKLEEVSAKQSIPEPEVMETFSASGYN